MLRPLAFYADLCYIINVEGILFTNCTLHSLLLMHPNYITVHCQPSLLDFIKENNMQWTYSPRFGEDEIDVLVFDNQDLDDEELVEAVGLNYNQVNCIELADDESCISLA